MTSFEGIGTEGDFHGARFRWDVLAEKERQTLLVHRLFLPLAQASVIVRKLFYYQPCLEHGLNVTFGLVFLRAVRGQAEGWPR
jgi:hypothetical protein